ncbi:MAG: N(4)-(beta-N-acetylglucosaminyl)-L-asparaginase [Sphaerobacter sp.]|nr:N(4)-(beta-N-acetylglucosaminyl)-L-asparaginase [Sphaerobacter sp.]MDI3341393.1 N(4)-(beta-N-acetylglucosaminyl)-L-asparaginase [Sphaerobacter sp.]
MARGAQVGVVVGSYNARVGLPAAIEILRAGGSALDAVVAAVKLVEDDLTDHGVGTGGIPNLLGQVELDASIMDGTALAAGAVGAVKHYPHPIEIARKVMEVTPHVMLVGEGAELFARYHGFEPANLLTEEAEREWRRCIHGDGEAPGEGNAWEDQYNLYMRVVKDWTKLLHKEIFGTTNVIARDREGNIACAVSTSGWGFKWPGRLGDSPIIGAGNYADSRFGAAACTGRGEMAIRAASAHSVVMYLRQGMPLEEALRTAMVDLRALVDPFAERDNVMNIVAMDREGNVAAASTSAAARFVFQTTEMDDPEERPRIHVPLREE